MKAIEELQKYAPSCSILYVEDDVMLLEATCSFLENFFEAIDIAKNGKEGLALFEIGKYEIVISDINMPLMNGIEMCHHIKQADPSQQILITSAHEESRYLFELINIGVEKFISKPFDMTLFIQSLLRLTKQSWQQKELTNYQKNLETMVAQQTIDLQTSNDALEALNYSLEARVEEELCKSRKKDEILISQARHSAMDDVLTHIAHQWRQPLNAIGLSVQHIGLLLYGDKIDTHKIETTIDEILDLLDDTSNTIDNFRSFFKPQGEKHTFDLKEVIQNTLLLTAHQYESDNITIEKQLLDDILLYGYPQELSQALLHLLTNAHQAFVRHSIKQRCIKITTLRKNNTISLNIIDNAGGIEKAHIEKIFDPYFTTEFEDSGKGIGLYLTKILVVQHLKGEIEVSTTSSGSHFSLTLPIEC